MTQQAITWSEKFIICLNCCGEPLSDEDSRDEENTREYMVCECPHCDGNKTEIDDNDPNGTKTCYYCDGQGWVSYDEAEAYREHDPNLM